MSNAQDPKQQLEADLQALEGLPNIHFGELPSPPEFARMLREANTPEEIKALNDLIDSAAGPVDPETVRLPGAHRVIRTYDMRGAPTSGLVILPDGLGSGRVRQFYAAWKQKFDGRFFEAPKLTEQEVEDARAALGTPWASPAIRSVFRAIADERRSQDAKWGADRSLHPSLWLTILAEEVGEVARVILDDMNRVGYYASDDVLTFAERLREELVQVAAVATAQIEQLDREAAS